MLTSSPSFLITYNKIDIGGKTYQLPVLKNNQLKKLQKKIKQHRQIILQGFRHNSYVSKLLNRREKISYQARFAEVQLLIQDYTKLIDFLQEYQHKYYNLLLILSEHLSKLFNQKYQELNSLEQERIKLEIKHENNRAILTQLKHEKKENLQTTLLLGKTYFLMLEKIKLLSEGIKQLAEHTEQQKENIAAIIKELEVYEEISKYQEKAQNCRQEVAKIAQKALDFPNYLQDFLSPFHKLLDEAIKIDEEFYGMVSEIKDLGEQISTSETYQFNLPVSDKIDDLLLGFMVNSYQKKETINEAILKSLLCDRPDPNLQLSDKLLSLYPSLEKLFNYLYNQFIIQKQLWQTEFTSLSTLNFSSFSPIKNKHLTSYNSSLKIEIDYSQLEKLLAKNQWKEADLKTTYLLLKAIGKQDWNQVYPEDIENFSAEVIQKIDQLWVQYSEGYFGFTVQERIWTQMGGEGDYETAKKFGECLGWRKNGKWLKYEQLIFDLSSTTPWGYLPVNWLIYDQQRSSSSSIEISSITAWRVDSWLIWQMNLFLSRVRNLRTLY